MKRLLMNLLILSALANCSRQESLTLAEEMQKLATPPQLFTIRNDRSDTLLTKSGIRLIIPPNTFVLDDGQTPNDSIRIEIKEVFEKSEMILNRIGTTSDGNLLESYGMIWLDATAGQKPLKIGSNGSIQLSIPNKRKGADGELFYGQEDAGALNWKYADQKTGLMEIMDTTSVMSTEGRITEYEITDCVQKLIADSVYSISSEIRGYESDIGWIGVLDRYEFDIKNLGWINCDRFIKIEDTINLVIELKDHRSAEGYLVFDSINSIMYAWFDRSGKAVVVNLPRNYTTDIVVIDKINGNIMWAKQRIKTGIEDKITLELQPIDTEALKKQMELLDK